MPSAERICAITVAHAAPETAPLEHEDKHQIERDVDDGRNQQEEQRGERVADAAQNRGEEVIQEREEDARKDDGQIRRDIRNGFLRDT